MAKTLSDRRILRADEGTLLLIFKRKIYPEINPRPEREIVERLRKAIFTSTRMVDPRTVILISLAQAADLLRHSFPKKDLRKCKKRIAELTSGDLAGGATREAVQAAQAAATMAVIMPAIAVATTAGR